MIVVPGGHSTGRMKEPERTTQPASSRPPRRPSWLASQARARIGWPSTPAARPVSLDLSVADQGAAGAGKIQRVRPEDPAAEDVAGVRGVVGDGVDDLARGARGGVGAQDAGVEDLEARPRPGHGIQRLRLGNVFAAQRLAQDEGDLRFHPRLDEAALGDAGAVGEFHVPEQKAAVGLSMPSACCMAREVRPTLAPVLSVPRERSESQAACTA